MGAILIQTTKSFKQEAKKTVRTARKSDRMRTVEGQAKRLDEAKAQDAPSAGTGRPTQERHAGTPAPSSDPGDR